VRRPSKRGLGRRRALRGKRGVSEVVGTILILALTVVLFSSIFFFVSAFPKPSSQPNSQFLGQLYYSIATKGSSTWTNVSYLTITYLAGSAVFSFNTKIYIVSQAHPGHTSNPYTLANGGLSAGTWATGQVWNVSLAADGLTIPDNLTVSVVSAGTQVYHQLLPATNPTIPPIFSQAGTLPGSPILNSSFSIFVQITDPFLHTTSKQVYLNTTTPGLSCVNPLGGSYATNTSSRLQMSYNATSGLWILGGCKTLSAGTYYVTVWVTDSNPIQAQQASTIFPVSVGTSNTGITCSNTYSVTYGAAPTTVATSHTSTIYLNVTNNNKCDWIEMNATITASVGTLSSTGYTGTVVAVAGTYAFTDTWTAPSSGSGLTATITITLSSPTKATGPTTETIKLTY
jgi:flagellin-like protein